MNKLIIICGGDRLGKGTLIKGLCEYFDYKNVTIRHCDKPPKNISMDEILDFQIKAFTQEFKLVIDTQTMFPKFKYHDNIVIFDRFYLGEYVYGQMFRNYDANVIKNHIYSLENIFLKTIEKYSDIYLITLTADPEFFLSKEDGQSFSQNLEQKTREIKLFKEAHEFSLIKNKLLLQVDDKLMEFRSKKEIFNEVINFINNKNGKN